VELVGHGVDDLRIFSLRSEHALPVYVAREYQEEVRDRFPYVFSEDVEADPGSSIPDLELRSFRDGETFRAAGFEVTAFGCRHGSYTSYGLRVGDLAVVVDAKEIPDEALSLLEGVRVLAVNALWFGNLHPTHFNVEEAVEAARRIGAERTYMTHMTHRLEHRETAESRTEGMVPAHDGLVVEL
jgi:phosphoribosyl 1,2-cyclic phosphate phosphodiesterase